MAVLPFTREAFFENFASYNEAIWPAQVVAYGLGVAIVVFLALRPQYMRGATLSLLALMWLWTGVAYHWLSFVKINGMAWVFGAAFVLQALLLAGAALRPGRETLTDRGAIGWAGWVFIAYAMVGYPLAGLLAGHAYPHMPVFGVAPCPVTIFTFGALLLLRPSASLPLFIIPFAWSLVGGSAAFLLDVPQDWFLLASGLLSGIVIWSSRKPSPQQGR